MSQNSASSTTQPLSPGLYEQLVNSILDHKLAQLRESGFHVTDGSLDAGDSSVALADYVRQVVRMLLVNSPAMID